MQHRHRDSADDYETHNLGQLIGPAAEVRTSQRHHGH